MPGYMKFLAKAPKLWKAGVALPGTHHTVRVEAIGGKIYAVTENGIFESNTDVSVWTKLTNLPTVKYDFGASGFGEFLYVLGGRTGTSGLQLGLKEAYRYHIPTLSWTTLTNLWESVWDLASCANGSGMTGYAYNIGGRADYVNDTVYYVEADRMLSVMSTWDKIPNMPLSRAGHAAIATGLTTVYVFGGYNGSGDTASALTYNGSSWSSLANMPFANKKMAATYTGNDVYLTGGSNNQTSFLKYNIPGNSWEQLTPMNTGKSNHGMVILNNCIYSVGGGSVEYIELV